VKVERAARLCRLRASRWASVIDRTELRTDADYFIHVACVYVFSGFAHSDALFLFVRISILSSSVHVIQTTHT